MVLFHAFPKLLKGGFIGVDIFFVISGYLITTIILENLESGNFSFKEFYARRIRRIFPALILVLLASTILGWVYLLATQYQQLGKHIAAGAAFLSNFILWSEAGYFDNAAKMKPLLHLWSLGIEEQFYIIWPFIVWLTWKLKFNIIIMLLAVIGPSFILNLYIVTDDQVAAFYSPQTRFWELLCGGLLASLNFYKIDVQNKIAPILGKALEQNKHTLRLKQTDNLLPNVLASLAMLLLILGLIHIRKTVDFPGTWALLPVMSAMLFILAGPTAYINRKILANKICVWFGLISFPLYLWHWLLISFAHIIEPGHLSNLKLLSLVAVSILLSWGTYIFAEKPVRFGNHKSLKTGTLIIGMIIIGGLGYIIHADNGYPLRQVNKLAEQAFSTSARTVERDFKARYKNYQGTDILTSTRPVILIVGDSYNKAWSPALSAHLNLVEYDVVSITYLGCNVSRISGKLIATEFDPKYKDNCQTFTAYINNKTITNRLAAVMLVSHRPFVYDQNLFRFDMIRWLRGVKAEFDFFVFGNYYQLDFNEIPSCEQYMIRKNVSAKACLNEAVYPKGKSQNRNLPFYPKDLNLKYVDIIDLHCGYDKKTCAVTSKGVPFMLDWNHLTATFLDFLLQDIREKKTDELGKIGLSRYFN